MKILEVGVDKLELVLPLFEAYRAFYRQPANEAGARDFLRERIEKGESIIYLLVDENGNALGFTQLYPLFSSTRIGRVWLLNDLFVDPDFRGNKVGEVLFDALRQLAVKRGWSKIRWITADDNYRARGLYDKLSKKTMWNTYEMEIESG